MNISVCITTLNEEKTIVKLLDALSCQEKKPDEIIIVDSCSTDKTREIISHYQKKEKTIKLLVEKSSRSKGRNLAIEMAKGDIIVLTDAGCVPKKDWIKKITGPLMEEKIEVVAGFYLMTYKNSLQKAMTHYLGVSPSSFNMKFLPSTRSIAFRKRVWEEIGGFSESLKNAAEDTKFNYHLLKNKYRISRMKDAVVEWGMPENLTEFFNKVKNYARGDVESKIWFYPATGYMSHNLRVILVFARYITGVLLLIFSLYYSSIFILLMGGFVLYLFNAVRKAGIWGIPLQFTSDIAVMSGFIFGSIS